MVGARAVSRDMLQTPATCTGLVLRRWRLARRSFGTLAIGLGFGCLVAGLMTAILNVFGLLPGGFKIGGTSFDNLFTVNASTGVVGFVAGGGGETPPPGAAPAPGGGGGVCSHTSRGGGRRGGAPGR